MVAEEIVCIDTKNHFQKKPYHILLVKRFQDPDWFTSYVEGNIVPQNIHSSEYAWAKSEFDFTIENNGTLQELNAKVDNFIHQLRDLPHSIEAA